METGMHRESACEHESRDKSDESTSQGKQKLPKGQLREPGKVLVLFFMATVNASLSSTLLNAAESWDQVIKRYVSGTFRLLEMVRGVGDERK